MKKSVFIFGLILFFWPFLARAEAPYYQSGDFKFEDGRGVIVAPNGVGIDILNLSKDGRLFLISRVLSKGQPFSAVFAKDGDEEVLVVASGRYLEKFLISDLERPVLQVVQEIPGHYFYQVSKITGDPNMVVLSSTKGVEIRLVKDFSLVSVVENESALGAQWDKEGFVAIVTNKKIIFQDKRGALIGFEDLTQKTFIRQPQAGKHFAYFPTDQGLVRLGGSSQVKMYKPKTLSGNSVLISEDEKDIYFANGWGIIKLDSDLRYKKSVLLSGSGFWAAGMARAVFDPKSAKDGKNFLVVFNGKGLRILNENLKIISAWEPDKLNVKKSFDVSVKSAGGKLIIDGSGFYPGEDVEIYKDGKILTFIKASNFGSFIISLDDFNSGVIKLRGGLSGLAFESYIKKVFSN